MPAKRSPHPELKFLPRLFMVPVPRTRAEWSVADRAGVPHFILFARDFRSAAGLQRLNRRLAARARAMGAPPLLALDEEGGLVSQLRTLGLEAPGPRVLARAGDPALARDSAGATARALRSLGFNLNFAPVADLDTARTNPVIGARSVGPDPLETGEWCAEWIRAHQAAGVATTAKHFPGHGDAVADSHLTLPVIHAPRAVLKRRELRPFLAASRAGVAAMMTAHVRYPALDPRLPATLSPRILSLLRGLMGFEGLVVSDSMDMAGVRGYGGAAATVRALAAGCDLLLYGMPGTGWRAGLRAVERAARTGELSRELLESALERVETVARTWPARAGARVATPPAALRRRWDRAVEAAMLVHGTLPSGKHAAIVVAGGVPQASALAGELRRCGLAARAGATGSDRKFNLLVIGGRSGWSPAEARATEDMRRAGQPFGVVSLLSEARLDEPPALGARLLACPFEDTPRALRALSRRIATLAG